MTTRRVNSRSDYYTDNVYVQGNVVRESAVPVRPEREYKERRKKRNRRQTKKNRAKARQMSRKYVFFLALASVATMFVCVHYIQLRAEVTSQLETMASLETQLNQLTVENNAMYNQIISDIDLEYVRDVAMNQLGMKYAAEDQIIWYNNHTTNSYVRQYQEVPE